MELPNPILALTLVPSDLSATSSSTSVFAVSFEEWHWFYNILTVVLYLEISAGSTGSCLWARLEIRQLLRDEVAVIDRLSSPLLVIDAFEDEQWSQEVAIDHWIH